MEKYELITKINEILADEFEVDISFITTDANIKKSLQLDSLSLVDMVALIEDSFSINIKSTDVSNIQTFGDLYNYVYERS